jgi:hypothetical protein
VAAQKGFCPYCAHVNPPDFRFCVNCQRKLPPEVLGVAAGGPPTIEDLNEAAGGGPTERPEPPPPKSARWVILILTIGIAAVVLVASVGLLTHFLPGSTHGGAVGNTGTLVRTDLCQNTSGVDCKGTQIAIPYTTSGGLTQNVSACYAIYPTGNTPRLWLNFTTASKMFGVLIPQSLYNGIAISYLSNPAGFYNTTSATSQASWNSGPVAGGQLVNVSISSGTSAWCLAWWNPGASGSVDLTADVSLYSAPVNA